MNTIRKTWRLLSTYERILIVVASIALVVIVSSFFVDTANASEARRHPNGIHVLSVSGSRADGFHVYHDGYDTWYPPLKQMVAECSPADRLCKHNWYMQYATFIALRNSQNGGN